MRYILIIGGLVVVVCGLTLGAAFFASGNGETTDEHVPPPMPTEFHAWIDHEEHIYAANVMHVRIRLFPDAAGFPGFGGADVFRLDDMVIKAMVRVEVSAPAWNAQITGRPEAHIQREQRRGRAALEFCRRAVLNASGLIVVKPHTKESDRFIHCDLLLVDDALGRVSLAKLLIENGFASKDPVDWGLRLPR